MLATVPRKRRPTEAPHRGLLQPETSLRQAGASAEAASHTAAETQGRPLASVNSHPNGMFAIVCIFMKEDTPKASSSGPVTSGPRPRVKPVSVSQLPLPGSCPALCPPARLTLGGMCHDPHRNSRPAPWTPTRLGPTVKMRRDVASCAQGARPQAGTWSPVLTHLRISHRYRLPPGILHVICRQVTCRPRTPEEHAQSQAVCGVGDRAEKTSRVSLLLNPGPAGKTELGDHHEADAWS